MSFDLETSQTCEHNIGIHPQALISHCKPIINHKSPIINPQDIEKNKKKVIFLSCRALLEVWDGRAAGHLSSANWETHFGSREPNFGVRSSDLG